MPNLRDLLPGYESSTGAAPKILVCGIPVLIAFRTAAVAVYGQYLLV